MEVIVVNCDDEEAKVARATKLVRKYQHSQLVRPICHVSYFAPCLLMFFHLASCVMSGGLSCLLLCCMSSQMNARDVLWHVISRHDLSCPRCTNPLKGAVVLRSQGNGDEPATPLLFASATRLS